MAKCLTMTSLQCLMSLLFFKPDDEGETLKGGR